MLSGFNSMDFSALCGLSGSAVLSQQQAEDVVYNLAYSNASMFDKLKTTAGKEAGFFRALMGGIYGAGYVLTSDTSAPAYNSSALRPVVESAVGNFTVMGMGKPSPEQITKLLLGLDNLSSVGYVVTKAGGSTTQAPNSSDFSLPSMDKITDQAFSFTQSPSGPVGVTTAARSSSTPARSLSPAPMTIAPLQLSRKALPVRRISQSAPMTALEKKRLIWIIGGFALIFAVAIGVIAARSE